MRTPGAKNKKEAYTHRIMIRLHSYMHDYLSEYNNPSEYIRDLIEKDLIEKKYKGYLK
jgi:hypothetical protein